MSQAPPPPGPPYQPPYGVPSGYPPGHPGLPRKPRPSGWWFVLGGALLVAAVVAGIALFVWTVSGFLDTDARVPADGRPHRVTVGTDGDRMLWAPRGSAERCAIVDLATGGPIALDPAGGRYDRSDGDGRWRGVARFDPGSGRLEITCTAADRYGADVLVGKAPRLASFVAGLLATVLVPLALGLAGLGVVIVTGILFATRAPRR